MVFKVFPRISMLTISSKKRKLKYRQFLTDYVQNGTLCHFCDLKF